MISPSARLLWFVGLIFVPACALPAFVPQGGRYIALVGLSIAIVLLLDLLISRSMLDGLAVGLPETIRAALNEPAKFSIELRRAAASGPASRDVRVAIALPREVEPVCVDILMAAPAAQQCLKCEMSLLGRERGSFSMAEAFLGNSSRFGLWWLRRTVPAASVILVEPPLAQISKEAARLLASHRHGGQRIVARNGRGREFEQLREYVPSDNFGDIDWKATARRRTPIVREYQVERTQDIYACIDFSRLSGHSIVRKDVTRATVLDEYIRSTLMLQCAVRQTGDQFGFATFSNHVESFVKATRMRSFDRLFRRSLYPLRPKMVAPAFDEVCGLLRTRAKRRALIVFFTSLAEPQLAEAFVEASRLLVRQHLVIVACPVDAHTAPLFIDSNVSNVEDIYGKLAGHLLWKKLADLRLQLANSGIRMHTVAPGRLGLVAATGYLDIKERQLL